MKELDFLNFDFKNQPKLFELLKNKLDNDLISKTSFIFSSSKLNQLNLLEVEFFALHQLNLSLL